MPSPAPLQASSASRDPTNLQYGETSDRRLARSLAIGVPPVVPACVRSVTLLVRARTSLFETGDPRSKARPTQCGAISDRAAIDLARIDGPGASPRRWEGPGPLARSLSPTVNQVVRDPAN